MTVIVGVIGPDGTVTMGADSAGSDKAGRLEIRKDSKLFRNGPYLIGCCGKWVVGQRLKFARLPEPKGELFKHMVTRFVPRLQLLLKGLDDYSMLVGVAGRIFHIYDDLQVAEVVEGYAAAGSGAQVARGALNVMDFEDEINDGTKVQIAMEAAERYCTDVRGPFTILSVGPGEK
jgi:ATP-dependent protease HslVU (ClpYQ) peptidase subunit